MLDQLVESREGYGDGARRGGFLLTTMVLVVTVFASGMLWSLFAKDLGIGGESLELSSLVAPVPVPAYAPPATEPPAREKVSQPAKEQSELPVRRENILQISESPITPVGISTVQNPNKARPSGLFTVAPNGGETDGNYSSSPGSGRTGGAAPGTGINGAIKPNIAEDDKEEPPVLKKVIPEPTPKKTVSLGVINGKATSLPKPPYPAPAKAIRAEGEVSVQVLIDETGRVVSAKAVSGHPLLKAVSEVAAQNAKFAPTLLSNQPVKVTGVIVYKFSAQ